MVESTLESVRQFLWSGATGSVTISVKPFTDIAVHATAMISKNGLSQHCIMPSAGFAKDLNEGG